MKREIEKVANSYDKKKQFITLLSGVLIAYVITGAAFICCALALTYTNFKESTVPMVVTITCVVSSAIAGFDTARSARGRGWLWGLIGGFAYAVIFVFLGKIMSESFSFDMRTLTLVALCIACGGLGGIIGINLKK